jgi:DNA-binding LacI/PurR family transcriptional regulator
MQDHHLTVTESNQFIEPSPYSYFNCDEIIEKLKSFQQIPTAYVCANDDTAKTFFALKHPPFHFLPQNTGITGFDNIPEYSFLFTEYATVEIHTQEIGLTVGEQVFWRIQNPERQFQTIRLCVKPMIY